jgi:hypothetical protein
LPLFLQWEIGDFNAGAFSGEPGWFQLPFLIVILSTAEEPKLDAVDGLPELPEPWSDVLLRVSVHAQVTEVLKDGRAIIDLGSADGIKLGMEVLFAFALGDGEDAGWQNDRFASEPVGIACAVEPFVAQWAPFNTIAASFVAWAV